MRTHGRSLVIALVMVFGITFAAAGVTSAAPDENAVCVAETINGVLAANGGQAFAQGTVVPDAQDGGSGEFIAPRASTDCAG